MINEIVEGIQEKKGKKIVVVDMNNLSDAPCRFFVIAEGDSQTHVRAVADSVKDYVRQQTKEKPAVVAGIENSEWVALDYGYIIVHIFQRKQREFYDLEHLWADAKLKFIEDLD